MPDQPEAILIGCSFSFGIWWLIRHWLLRGYLQAHLQQHLQQPLRVLIHDPFHHSITSPATMKTIRSAAQPVSVEVVTDSPLLTSPAASIDLVGAINANHELAQDKAAQAKALGDSAVGHAILAGLQLVQLKEQTPHGKWEALFTSGAKRIGKAAQKSNGTHVTHLLKFDRKTASRYIAVATQLVSRKLQPEQSAVLMALASGAPLSDESIALLDEITPPKSLRQTYLELGIVKPTPKEAAWLAAAPAEPPAEKDGKSPITKAATKLRSARESARREWFGTEKAGRVEPGSPVGLVLNELKDPAKGTLRLLSKADLEKIAEEFRSLAKRATEHAKEK